MGVIKGETENSKAKTMIEKKSAINILYGTKLIIIKAKNNKLLDIITI